MSSVYPLHLKNPALAGLLAWLVPGLGHAYQGRWFKAILFAICIHGLFWTGMAHGSWKVVWLRMDPQEYSWSYLAQIGVGAAALPALVNASSRDWLPEPLKTFQLPPDEAELNLLHLKLGKLMDVAIIYTIIAGLLNYFVIYDAIAGPAMRAEEEADLESTKTSKGAS
ncbi:hypothetical protein K2X85_10785 [bacterium]|jgi:hypothetical protein|nr:hypothetical protein [bacterium]